MARRNSRIVVSCLALVAMMVGMSYAAVPLYEMFCKATGFGGTTQQAEGPSDMLGKTRVTVAFDASLHRDMPWTFKAVQPSIELQTGETALAFYRATNLSDQPVTGTATFNVSPQKVGAYFVKIDCFCFTEQTLQPGQSVDMPVQFYVDPDIEQDVNTDEVKTITLSYTFFEAQSDDDGERDVKVSAALGGAATRE